MAELYESVLDIPVEQMGDIMQSPHTGVALQAAWQQVRATMIADPSPQIADAHTDKLALQRFLGFVDGRLPVRTPVWWEAQMAEVRYYTDRKLLWFPLHSDVSPYHATESGWTVHRQVNGIVEEADALKIDTDSGMVSIPVMLLQSAVEDGLDYGLAVAILDSERVIVAPHGDSCASFPLYCVARASGDLL